LVNSENQWARVLGALEEPAVANPAARRELLETAVQLAGTVTGDSAGCSVTETFDGGYRTPVSSNSLALELDEAQYAADDGPCIAACRDGQLHSITTMEAERQYPQFTAAAEQHGVRSSLSLPLSGARRASALNLYAANESAFESPRSRATAELLARCIARLLPEPAPAPPPSGVALETAMANRTLIGRAEALLGERDGLSAEDAFEEMTRRSRSENCSIFSVARTIVGIGDVDER
jgi:ANTAR domain-containing protein/GAF domain-containing protein